MNHIKNKILIIFLIFISLLVTSGTFAYWATAVEGTSQEAVSRLTIGSAVGVETEFVLSNEFSSGGLLVPENQLYNSGDGAVDSIYLSYSLEWNESSEVSQLDGTVTTGPVSVADSIKIYQDGNLLSYTEHKDVYDLIHVTHHIDNASEMILNGDAELFQFTITMDEPSNQEQYQLIHSSEIKLSLVYEIFENSITTVDEDGKITENPELPQSDLEIELKDRIVLNGEDLIYVELGSSYIEPGFTAYNSEGTIASSSWIEGGINTYSLTTQTLTYKAYSELDNKFITPVSRQIVVVDTTAPTIHMNEKSLSFNVTDNNWITLDYVKSTIITNFWATDISNDLTDINFDGIDEIDINQEKSYPIKVTVQDGSGNVASYNLIVQIQ